MDFKEFIAKLQALPEHKKKIILWTVVAVLGIIMGFFWVRGAINSFSKIGQSVESIEMPSFDTSNAPTMPSIDITTPTNEAVTVQTADWKTYTFNANDFKTDSNQAIITERNLDQCNFEIKYPSNWAAYTWPLHGAMVPEGLFIEEDPQNHNSCSFQVSFYGNPDKEKYCFPLALSSGKKSSGECQIIFNQMLSTLKFLGK